MPKKNTYRKGDNSRNLKCNSRVALSLPPPPKVDKQVTPVLSEEKKLSEGKSVEEKLKALIAYPRANDLCIKCAEKWSQDHTCAPTVQLHAMLEVMDLFSLEEFDDNASFQSQDQLFLALSSYAVSCSEGRGFEGPIKVSSGAKRRN